MELDDADVPRLDGLADLTPTFSVAVLHSHPEADPAAAFRSLCGFLRTKLAERGRAKSVRCLGEIELGESGQVEGIGSLLESGLDGLFAAVRERRTVPSWAGADEETLDVTNQLTLVLRRGSLVIVHTPVTEEALRKWLRRFNKLYRYLPGKVLRGTFTGDGRLVWLRGVHRRRATKADSKTLGGIRIQEALDDDEDASYKMSAATIDYIPADDDALVRGRLTVSPVKSRIYWKYRVDLHTFIAAAVETVDVLDKAIADEPPSELFPQLAVPETDLDSVRGAYDITVADLDEVFVDPNADIDELTERVELLRDSFLEVRGRPDSAAFTVVVGCEGAEVGELSIKPAEHGDGFQLDVGFARTPSWEDKAREIRDAIGDGDLLTVYYESGHTFGEGQINVQNQTAPPFAKQEFADFSGFKVTREKPPVTGDQAIHDAIGRNGDTSLFAWVAQRYKDGWLVCDDGAGEVADFLHLDNHGVLTAIHVKGAHTASPSRHVAVTAFQEVVAQAVKNVRLLDSDMLADRFAPSRIERPAAWFDGRRVTDLTGFVDQLRYRTAQDKTYVGIVQPHLRRPVRDAARAAYEAGAPTRDSRSLMLLDGLLRTARKAVISRWDDLIVIGSE